MEALHTDVFPMDQCVIDLQRHHTFSLQDLNLICKSVKKNNKSLHAAFNTFPPFL